jgi:phosphoglucosamine mutase
MTNKHRLPARLQGTDGVRRHVRPAAGFSEGPLDVFLKHGVMTEEFFELYCYAQVRDMVEAGKMAEGDDVLIGWDSRDRENFYTSRAVSGISKAGARPVLLGAFPTPGVAISLVCLETAAAFVITASHNPRDQNGIKIFLGPNGRKLMPDEDEGLSKRIYAEDFESIRHAEEKFHPFDASGDERERFIHFHLDRRNNWIDQKEKIFSKTVVVVDPAHGSLCGLAAMVFSELAFEEVIEVASEQNGDVNKDSGVAYLEGISEITADVFDSGAGIAKHELVKMMFKLGRSAAKGREHANSELLGVSFDADGDRFFVLIFDKEGDRLRVLSGDESLALQAEYLMRSEPEKWKGKIFACTVESDINLARHAEGIGFEPVITAVGDKWILHKAMKSPDLFGLGGEETGHSISQGATVVSCRDEKRIFTGNGLKGALNTMAALHKLSGAQKVWEVAKEPFETGFRHSSYAYYVKKELFYRDSEVWKGAEKTILAALSDISLKQEEMEGEPDMLYMKILAKDGKQVGSIFARNSGTENKISVNARGSFGMADKLKQACENAIVWLAQQMFDASNPTAAAQARILQKLIKNIQPKIEEYKDVDLQRLLHEMELKQKLIAWRGTGYAITPVGEKMASGGMKVK